MHWPPFSLITNTRADLCRITRVHCCAPGSLLMVSRDWTHLFYYFVCPGQGNSLIMTRREWSTRATLVKGIRGKERQNLGESMKNLVLQINGEGRKCLIWNRAFAAHTASRTAKDVCRKRGALKIVLLIRSKRRVAKCDVSLMPSLTWWIIWSRAGCVAGRWESVAGWFQLNNNLQDKLIPLPRH